MGFVQPRTALVTGASSGIGRAVARQLAQRGLRTVLVARRREMLLTLADELRLHAASTAVPLDLADASLVERVMSRIEREHGPIDVVVHAAGFGMLRAFLDQCATDTQRSMQVHYFAAVQMARAFLPAMVERRRGHMIHVGSIAAKVGPWGHGAYSAAKAALWSFTQTLQTEYGQRGLHFSYVQPGIVRSAFFDDPSYNDLGRSMMRHAVSCEFVAQRIVRLLDRPRLELIVPRHHRVVDWLKLLAPAVVQGLIAKQSRPRDGSIATPLSAESVSVMRES